MQASGSPTLIPLPFASSGTKNTIPEASQIGITPGAASLTDGFPPLTFTPIAAGGVPPRGADFNGVLNLITATLRWQHAGGQFKWNSAFATDSNVGGYPAGATLARADGAGFWLNLADNNATNPDATDGTAANWVPLEAYGITAVTGLTNANVTLTPPQYGLPIITLAGALTGNVQIIFPAIKSQWVVINNTTGAFSVTAKTAAGTGVIVAPGGSANLYGDGTNIVLPNALQVGAATQSSHAPQLGQVLPLAGGTMVGAIVMPNNVALQAKTTGGAATPIAYMDPSNNATFGNNAVPTVIGGSTIQSSKPISIPVAAAAGQAMSEAQAFGSPLQSYASKTGSRALNTTYTNSTTRPIWVAVACSSTGTGAIGSFVSGLGETALSSATASGQAMPINTMVPPGGTYIVSTTGAAATLATWNEYA